MSRLYVVSRDVSAIPWQEGPTRRSMKTPTGYAVSVIYSVRTALRSFAVGVGTFPPDNENDDN